MQDDGTLDPSPLWTRIYIYGMTVRHLQSTMLLTKVVEEDIW
jgi:hypothetical protein